MLSVERFNLGALLPDDGPLTTTPFVDHSLLRLWTTLHYSVCGPLTTAPFVSFYYFTVSFSNLSPPSLLLQQPRIVSMSMTDTELFNEAYSAEDDAKAMPSDLLSHFVKQYLELESYKSVSRRLYNAY